MFDTTICMAHSPYRTYIAYTVRTVTKHYILNIWSIVLFGSLIEKEIEKEGLIDSVAGKGFFVASQNPQLLKERQLRVVEDHLGQAAVRGHRIIKQRIIGKTESL